TDGVNRVARGREHEGLLGARPRARRVGDPEIVAAYGAGRVLEGGALHHTRVAGERRPGHAIVEGAPQADEALLEVEDEVQGRIGPAGAVDAGMGEVAVVTVLQDPGAREGGAVVGGGRPPQAVVGT